MMTMTIMKTALAGDEDILPSLAKQDDDVNYDYVWLVGWLVGDEDIPYYLTLFRSKAR